MTTEKAASPDAVNVLMRALELTGNATVKRDSVVPIAEDRKVHIWLMSNKDILVILQEGRKLIGVDKRKGSYDAIHRHYLSMQQSSETVH